MENKETLEEVAKKLTKDFPHYSVRDRISDSDIKRWFLEALQKGAKWQAEKMYSEEDMIEFGKFCYNDAHSVYKITTFKELLEKFKNK
jgi:4-alpha-glucanotransferase